MHKKISEKVASTTLANMTESMLGSFNIESFCTDNRKL